MDRRKFLIGAGSLAAGGAAAMGSGAFTQATLADRPVSVSVVPDDEGFLSLSADEDEHANGEYAEVNDDGELQINLNEDANIDQKLGFGIEGQGLNPNATYYIDDLFGVYNGSENDGLDYGIDWSGLDHPGNFEFYWMPNITQKDNSRPDVDRNGNEDDPYVLDGGVGGTPSGSYESFGLAIKTPDKVESEWETGTVEVFGGFE